MHHGLLQETCTAENTEDIREDATFLHRDYRAEPSVILQCHQISSEPKKISSLPLFYMKGSWVQKFSVAGTLEFRWRFVGFQRVNSKNSRKKQHICFCST